MYARSKTNKKVKFKNVIILKGNPEVRIDNLHLCIINYSMIFKATWLKYFFIIILVSFLKTVNAQRSSPCPDILKYEERSKGVIDRWFANISLETNEDLEGVWVRLVLDYEASLLVNWLGDATTRDNKEFIIRNRTHKVEGGHILYLKIQVVYNAADVVPSVKKIDFNGRTLCVDTRKWAKPVQSIPKTIPRYNYENAQSHAEIFPGDFQLINGIRNSPSNATVYRGNIECGKRAKKGVPLISFGTPSKHGDWPWHIALLLAEHGNYTCGGTLLNKNYVLTAAHCVTDQSSGRPLRSEEFIVHLGRTNLNKTEFSKQSRELSRIVVHPNFNNTYYHEDLALLQLSYPVDITDFVRPICLWSDGRENLAGRLGTVVGWGFNQTQTITEQLQEIKMPIIDKVTCIYSNPDFYNKYTSITSFCAGYANGTSVCAGDSGGGMYFTKGPKDDVTWEIRGIVSHSLAIQGKLCDTRSYSVFTDIAYHMDWIKEEISKY